jgi:hypothetical protein
MKTLADPTNKFLQSMANAVGEDVDREIIRAVVVDLPTWSTTWAPVPVIGSSEINGLNIEPP